MRHGYTNATRPDTRLGGREVRKTYAGPDALERLAREREALRRLRGRVPVPPVLGSSDLTLRLGFVAGEHGQDLVDAGHAAAVLSACGTTLRDIHAAGLVHGDYGPNNVLLDPAGFRVTAVLDWEFTHPGRPVEDLAWCEWIMRTHHPAHAGALEEFFAAYGHVPLWTDRQEAMLARCHALAAFCERWEPGGAGVRLWRDRAAATARWREG